MKAELHMFRRDAKASLTSWALWVSALAVVVLLMWPIRKPYLLNPPLDAAMGLPSVNDDQSLLFATTAVDPRAAMPGAVIADDLDMKHMAMHR